MRGGLDILIDFDGTVVTHEFPNIGKDIGAVPVLKELVANNHRLILFTMRSNLISYKEVPPGIVPDKLGNFLNLAVNWFIENDIPLYGVQVNPSQHSWTESPKAYGQLMIDDIALGAPIKRDPNLSSRPFIDWVEVRKILVMKGLISK